MTTLSCCGTDITMESAKDNFTAFLRTCDIDEQTFAVIVSVVVVIISIVALLISRSRRRKRTNVLILGISESGKTHMFSKLVAGDCKPKETLTSLKENESTYIVEDKPNKPLNIVDVPGHEAIRLQFLEKHKSKARGVIFVVDSETFLGDIKDVAEYLYNVFTDKTLNKIHPQVCIACNKQDLVMAKSKRLIQTKLEEELNTVRKTQSAALSSLAGGNNSDRVYLGVKGQDFQFQQLKKFKIQFLEINSKETPDCPASLDDMKKWIASLV